MSNPDFDRETRVWLFGSACLALREDRRPPEDAARFLGTAGMGWLEDGGDLTRDWLGLVRRASHMTPQRVWSDLQPSSRMSHCATAVGADNSIAMMNQFFTSPSASSVDALVATLGRDVDEQATRELLVSLVPHLRARRKQS